VANADLLLHPIRLRIVKAFLGDRALTTSQLAAELGSKKFERAVREGNVPGLTPETAARAGA